MITIPTGLPDIDRIYARTIACGHRIVAVTGADPDDGTTTLAMALAERSSAAGIRTLLVDLNVVRPMLPGGGDYLLETEGSGSALIPTGIDNLDMAPAPTRALRRPSLRDPRLLRERLTDVTSDYGAVIIDCAPVLAAEADSIPAELAAAAATATVLSLRSGRTSISHAQAAIERLNRAGANLVGVVINDRHSPALADELIRETKRIEPHFPRVAAWLQGFIARTRIFALPG